MLKHMGLWATFAVGLWAGSPIMADETAPQLLASQCLACHNPVKGNAIPRLGTDAERIKTMLLAFRADTLPSTIMGKLAKGYTDAEIDALAAEIASWGEGERK